MKQQSNLLRQNYWIAESSWPPVHLRTPTALGVGESYREASLGVDVTVNSQSGLGFLVTIGVEDVRPARCGEIDSEIAFSEDQIVGHKETIDQLDPRRDRVRIQRLNAHIEALEQEISNLRQEAVSLGC